MHSRLPEEGDSGNGTPARNPLLGGSWVVISGVRTVIRGLITPLITTHEPPSNDPRAHGLNPDNPETLKI